MEPSIATHEVRLNRFDRDLDKLGDICTGLVKTQGEIATTIRLHQDAQQQLFATQKGLSQDVEALKKQSTAFAGGWRAVCFAAALFAALAKIFMSIIEVALPK